MVYSAIIVKTDQSEKNALLNNKQQPFFKPLIQPKLTINQPGDEFEQEADAMADKVMRMKAPLLSPPRGEETFFKPPDSSLSFEEGWGKAIQRKCAECEEEEKQMQRKESSSDTTIASPQTEDYINSLSGGRALNEKERSFFEPRMGYDFGNVKIHTGSDAAKSAQSINALAYTTGNNIVFNTGQYAPGTDSGKRLLGHELTHVIQQGQSSGISNTDLSVNQNNNYLQRNCADGNCSTCAGGKKDFWITVFFRRRATRDTMNKLRTQINGAKAILANCCLDLKFDFNWSLLPGGGSLPAFEGDPAGVWHYTADEQALGEGTTFSGARGIPMLVVDDVPLSGGGVTVDPRFDTTYTGRSFFAIGINQTTTPNPNCNHIAHELWHVASGLSAHDPANGTVTSCTGAGVTLTYCNNLRSLI